MKHSDQNTVFNVALVTLAKEVGAQKAIDLFFETLEDQVEYKQVNKIVSSFFDEMGISPEDYDEENYTFSNEPILRKALAKKLEIIKSQPRIS